MGSYSLFHTREAQRFALQRTAKGIDNLTLREHRQFFAACLSLLGATRLLTLTANSGGPLAVLGLTSLGCASNNTQ